MAEFGSDSVPKMAYQPQKTTDFPRKLLRLSFFGDATYLFFASEINWCRNCIRFVLNIMFCDRLPFLFYFSRKYINVFESLDLGLLFVFLKRTLKYRLLRINLA